MWRRSLLCRIGRQRIALPCLYEHSISMRGLSLIEDASVGAIFHKGLSACDSGEQGFPVKGRFFYCHDNLPFFLKESGTPNLSASLKPSTMLISRLICGRDLHAAPGATCTLTERLPAMGSACPVNIAHLCAHYCTSFHGHSCLTRSHPSPRPDAIPSRQLMKSDFPYLRDEQF